MHPLKFPCECSLRFYQNSMSAANTTGDQDKPKPGQTEPAGRPKQHLCIRIIVESH